MIKDFLWKTFENTGNIEAYMVYKEIGKKDKTLNQKKIAEDEIAISK